MSVNETTQHPRRGAGDGGFTVVEILMATVVLLIAFSGIMSLMVATTYMNIRAREKATMVNVANSVVERVRQMKYDDIGTPYGTPPGTLVSFATTVDGYTVEVTPTVAPLDDPRIWLPGKMKVLTLEIRAATGPDDPAPMTYTVETIIKKTDSGIDESAILPTVNRTPASPVDGAVVRGQEVAIGGQGAANGVGTVLTSMNIYCDGVPLKDRWGATAQWSLTSGSFITAPDFKWDTLAVNDSGVPLSVDGVHTIRLEAWDSNGKQGFIEWTVMVDNAPPLWPADGWVTGTPTSATNMQVEWSPAYDGNTTAYAYRVRPTRDDSSSANPALWPALPSFDVSGTTTDFTTDPFSRYHFALTAVGPPTLSAESTSGSSTEAVSRPDATGSTWSNIQTNRTIVAYVSVRLSPPTFPYTSAVSTIYRSTSASMAASSPVAAFVGWSPPQYMVYARTANGWPTAPAFYYQVKTEITPAGGTPLTVYSQVLGPSGTGGSMGSVPLATARW